MQYEAALIFEAALFCHHLSFPTMVQRGEAPRSKLSSHPAPLRPRDGSVRLCALVVGNAGSAGSLIYLNSRCSWDFAKLKYTISVKLPKFIVSFIMSHQSLTSKFWRSGRQYASFQEITPIHTAENRIIQKIRFKTETRVANVELSSRVEYALLALLELATPYQKDSPLTVNEIAAFQEIPERYLDQILNVLRRAGIVQSLRGAKGGYLLAKQPGQINLLEVVVALEGDSSHKDQKVSESETIEKTVVRSIWLEVRHASLSVLEKYTLQDLCEQRDDRKQVNPMYYI